jgi:hypothetical protein
LISAGIEEETPDFIPKDYVPLVSTIIVPAVVSIINAIIPTVVWIVVKISKWDSVGTEIKQQVD